MTKEVEVLEGLPNIQPKFSLGDLFKYLAIIEELIPIWAGLSTLQVGQTQTLTVLKLRIGAARYSWNMGSITRDA